MILQGDGALQIESQWDACVARNASKLAFNKIGDGRISEIALELCEAYSSKYFLALAKSNSKLDIAEVGKLIEYKRESLAKIALSEIDRARKFGCEAK